MNYWIIVSAALALACIALIIINRQQRGELLQRREQELDTDELRRQTSRIRSDNARRRREIAALHRALEAEQDHSDALECALEELRTRISDAEQRAEQADARRIGLEKEIAAGRMRAGLLEQQLRQAMEEQNAQEQLYQDIIRERDETIVRLQDAQPKRKPRKKPEILGQQITLGEILKGA